MSYLLQITVTLNITLDITQCKTNVGKRNMLLICSKVSNSWSFNVIISTSSFTFCLKRKPQMKCSSIFLLSPVIRKYYQKKSFTSWVLLTWLIYFIRIEFIFWAGFFYFFSLYAEITCFCFVERTSWSENNCSNLFSKTRF